MAIDFPASPTVGQVFVVGSVTYTWDGTKWKSNATNSPFSLGSASTPSITFIGDSNTGIYSPGADQVSIATGGTERVRFDSTGQLESVSLGTAAAPAFSFTTDSDTGLYSPGANQVAISTNSSERIRIGANGEIGIAGANYGTSGQVLTSGGSGATPSWQTLSVSANSITQGNTTAEVIDTGSDGRFVVTTEGSERLRIDSSGRLLVGTSSARANFKPSDFSAVSQVELATTGNTLPCFSLINNANSFAYQPAIFLGRSRGTTLGSNTIVQSNDYTGSVTFFGSDGTRFIETADISAVIDGTPGANDMPGRLVFSTTADGAASPTERLRIDSSGNLTINSQGDLRFGDADNSNWVGFQAPATVASNVIWTLPAADGTASQVLGTNGSGVLSFLTAGASLNVAAKSTNYTAVAADKSYLFTATGSWTLSLTAAATLGNGWYLFLKNIGTGQITVDPDASELIGGVSTAVSTPGDLWLITCTGTEFVLNRLEGRNFSAMGSSGTFTVPAGVYEVFVEVQGAGGGGASASGDFSLSAGGSGGGYAAKWCRVTPGESISVTVGSGGAGGASAGIAGSSGGSSSFNAASGTVTGSGGQGGATSLSISTVLTNAGVGSGSGGDINISGGRGWCNYAASTSLVISFGGSSKFSTINSTSSYFGSSQSVGPTSAPGTGGGGASRDRFNSGYTGGNGLVLIQWV